MIHKSPDLPDAVNSLEPYIKANENFKTAIE
jgi:hypothetical protein